MRNFINTLCFFAIFMVGSQTTNAQVGLFGSLLEQLDSTDQSNFLDILDNFPSSDSLNGTFNLDSLDFGGAGLDSLFLYLDSIPLLDSTYLDALTFGADTLSTFTDSTFLPYFDSLNIDAIISEYGNIDTIFNLNFDSLGNLFDIFGDSIDFSYSTSQTIDLLPGNPGFIIDENLATLYDSLNAEAMGTNEVNAGTFSTVFDQLFSGANFSKLELAFGVQEGHANYYGEGHNPKAKVIRVGSVPNINTNNLFSSSWHVQGSWIGSELTTADNDSGNNSSNGNGEGNGFVPLMFNGHYAFMANPTIGSPNIRVLTSLGMEVGTYAPSHSDFSAETADNKGFTTGLGLQVGTGFAVRVDDITVYSIGTYAFGNVLQTEEEQYHYSSLLMSAGVTYSDKINVRYTAGKYNWAGENNKEFKLNHQITIGIILAELRR